MYYFVFEKSEEGKCGFVLQSAKDCLKAIFINAICVAQINIFHFSNQFLCVKIDFFPTLSYCESITKPVG